MKHEAIARLNRGRVAQAARAAREQIWRGDYDAVHAAREAAVTAGDDDVVRAIDAALVEGGPPAWFKPVAIVSIGLGVAGLALIVGYGQSIGWAMAAAGCAIGGFAMVVSGVLRAGRATA